MPLAERSEATQPLPGGAATTATDDTGLTPVSALTVEAHGAALYPSAALSILPDIEAALAPVPPNRAGVRLTGLPALADLLDNGPIHAVAAAYLTASARPVRALLFDKTPVTNWALGWHQDRTIAVRQPHETPGFGPWTTKAGLTHVEPPFAIIEAMVTLRIHLDDVPADNAPLLIAPGSHRLGRITELAIQHIVAGSGSIACLARSGDVWAYATPILHASAASRGARRRVLQVDYTTGSLPGSLEWLGV